jgi:hypothetical protein
VRIGEVLNRWREDAEKAGRKIEAADAQMIAGQVPPDKTWR